MNNINDPSILDKFHKGASIGALTLTLIMLLGTGASRFTANDQRGAENSAQIEALKTQSALQQKQIDQDQVIQEQLKVLAAQTKTTQEEVRDLSINLQAFEGRFLVTPRPSAR